MADNFQNFRNGINLGQLAADPANPNDGDIYYNTTSNAFRGYQNGAWTDIIGATSNPINLTQISTPSAPTAGTDDIYFKNDDNLYIQNSAGVETPILQSGSAAFASYASSQITTQSTGITNTSFETFSNSPAFTFTPTITGVYKIYASVVAENVINNDQATLRIFNTAGGATLISESQGAVEGHLTGYGTAQYSSYIQSTYTLIAGTSYIFDIQAKVQSGDTVYMDGSITNFCMFAEGIGLNGTLNTGGTSFALFTSNVVNTQSSANTSPYPTFATFSNSPAFTFTPVISGKYKVYANANVLETVPNNDGAIRIFNTSGGATLLSESQGYCGIANIVSNNFEGTVYTQSVYELTAGTPYVFDIQGTVDGGSGNLFLGTTVSQFYMYAEGIGLSNTSENFPVNMKVTGTGSWSASANIILGTISWDSNSAYNTSTGEYTVPYAGYYLVGWNANATTATKQVGIYVNGVQQELIDNGYSADPGAVGTSTVVKVNAGDIITWVANIGFSANVTTQWVSSISLANALLGPQGRTTGSAFAYYTSSAVTTVSTLNPSTSFVTFSNSPAFTFTPTISGIYKIYASVPLNNQGANTVANARVFNTSGGATLLQESQAGLYAGTPPTTSNEFIQSVYSLNAGTTYVFDIQGQVNSGAGVYLDAPNNGSFYMFAEGVGLSGQFQSPVTPWQSNLSVTPSASFGSYTGLKTLTRVVGDTMEFKVYLTVGTSVSSIMSLALPAGYTIDASKLSNGQSLLNGFATSITTSSQSINTSTWATYPFFDGSDISNIYFTPSTGTTTTQQFDKAFALNFAEGGAPWVAEFSVPIVGLYGGQLDGVSTIAKSASTGVSWSIPYNASFNPVLDPGTNPLKAIITTNGGDVEIGMQDDGSGNPGSVYADDRNNASSTVTLRFKRNGIVVASQVMFNQNNISIHEMQIPSSAFKYIDSPPPGTWTYTVEAMTSGSTAANSQITYSIIYAKPLSALGGQAGGMSSENVNAQVYLSSPVAITAGSPIVFNAVDFDTNNAYNISTGQYTIPLAGTYEVAITAYTEGAAPAFSLYKNGSPTTVGGGYITDDIISPQVIANGTRLVTCVTGDILTIVPDTTATLGVNYSAWSIKKIATGGSGPSAWLPYTPTFTGMGSVTTQTFWYKYDGADSISIKGTWIPPTPDGSVASVSLPVSYTINSSKVNGTAELTGYMTENANNGAIFTVVLPPSGNALNFSYATNTNGGLSVGEVGTTIFSGGNTYSFTTSAIPIA